MEPRSQRRAYGAEFKAQAMAECQQPGASVATVATVAISNGLAVKLVRNWLVGRGLKRAGLAAPRTAQWPKPAPAPSAPLQFLPLDRPAPTGAAALAESVPAGAAVDIELQRAGTGLRVRWPARPAQSCAVWLRKLAAAVLAR